MDDVRQQLNEVIDTAARHASGPEPAELRRRLRRRRQRRGLATVALLLGAGIALPNFLGLREPPPVTPTGPAPVRRLACGDITFPETSLFAPAGAETGRDPAARALAAFLASEAAKDPWVLPKTGWKQLTRDNDRAMYGLGRPGTVDFAVRIRRQGTQWKWVGYGTCRPQVVVPGFEIARWELTSKTLSPGTRVVPIAFETGACVKEDRFDHAQVVTTDDAVTITVYLRPIQLPPGTACAAVGRLAHRDVALPEPLGRRALLDGSTVPAEVIRPA
jgi:hypothetical protein